MILTPEKLKQVLQRQFPIDTVTWACATDEVRDMSRSAREWLGLPAEAGLNFHELHTPSQWNTRGINSIVDFYTRMDNNTRQSFLEGYAEWFNEWCED